MKIRTSKYKKITKKKKKIQLKIRTESKTKTKLNKKMKIKLLKKTHCGSKLPLKNKNWHEKKKEKKIYMDQFSYRFKTLIKILRTMGWSAARAEICNIALLQRCLQMFNKDSSCKVLMKQPSGGIKKM